MITAIFQNKDLCHEIDSAHKENNADGKSSVIDQLNCQIGNGLTRLKNKIIRNESVKAGFMGGCQNKNRRCF